MRTIGQRFGNELVDTTKLNWRDSHEWFGFVWPKAPKNLRKLRNHSNYKAWKLAVFKKDSHRCQWCGRLGNLHAHHIKPFSFFPDLRYEVSNGITLCKFCHRKTDTWGTISEERKSAFKAENKESQRLLYAPITLKKAPKSVVKHKDEK